MEQEIIRATRDIVLKILERIGPVDAKEKDLKEISALIKSVKSALTE